MNKDQVKGRATEVAGKIKKKVGRAIDDESMETDGVMTEAKGIVQKKFGDLKRAVARKIDQG